jgi:hypothetical protein
MKTYWRGGSITPRILDSGTRRLGISFTPRPLYPRCLLDRRLGGPQSRSGCGGEEKNSQTPSRIEPTNHDHPARTQSLYRLSHPALYFIKMCMNRMDCIISNTNQIRNGKNREVVWACAKVTPGI